MSILPRGDTELLIRSVHIEAEERVLEPFAGTGAISIFLAPLASIVIATDANPSAVSNMVENVQLHAVTDKVKVVLADIFPKNEGKFDVIVANPPYTDHEARDIAEKSMWDKNHETVKRFFREAKNYLAPNGRIYCSWSIANCFNF